MKFQAMKWVVGLAVVAWGFLAQVDTAAANVGCYLYSAEVGMVCSAAEQPLPIFAAPVQPLNSPLRVLTHARQADNANVYSEPNGSIVRNVGDGYLFASLQGQTQVDGVTWYQINPGEWMKASDLTMATATTFQGVTLLRQPPRPFGWVVTRNGFYPSHEPAGEPDTALGKMNRYDFFEVYDAVVDEEGWLWYDLGDGRWIRQTEVSLVDVKQRPAEVGPDEYWTEVDLYEQTFAAYEGDRMVFATLISSGLNRWPTHEGIFQVFDRWVKNKMSGAEGLVDYYFIEDINHIMYFDPDMEIALHGAFWHDRFGYKHSHGCVNMVPTDAEWVYNWSAQAENDLWVWVHTSDPNHYFDVYDN
ncbi:MAG: L,D-transpeptidase [Chloroflexi bacterium]|nr:L,D-transpeptidase [Chloroflexota bacterium]